MVEKIKHSLQSFYIVDKFKEHKKLKTKLLEAINDARSDFLEQSDTYYTDNIERLDWLDAKKFHREWVKIIYPHLSKFLKKKLKDAGYDGCVIKNIWFQQYGDEGRHGWHVHGHTFTGAYYLDLPKDGPLTEIIDPFDHGKITPLKVKEGDVSIFPAYAVHRSPKNTSKNKKTIISFNLEINKPVKKLLDKINSSYVLHANHPDYLYSIQLNSIDNKKLVSFSLEVEKMLRKNLPVNTDPSWYGTFTTANHHAYNFLTFPNYEVGKLYQEILKNVSPLLEDRPYMIKSWVNVFRKGEKVDWHNHWPADKKVWHGFYCVQVGDSHTDYRIPKVPHITRVVSKEGLLVVGKSEDDQHRSSPWNENKRPRITIAFDIVPIDSIDNKLNPNHFIPFTT